MAAKTSLLLYLPEELVEKVISYLTYEEISESRLVCGTFNKICQQLLNQGFSKVDKFHALCQKEVKTQLPRRESERRNHPLARHVDILGAIETRLSLLSMTFMKYIDMGLCCFIPGKVLDEMIKVLLFVKKEKNPPRAHELLQELRDISSMAMEHFDEKIVPACKKSMQANQLVLSTGSFPGCSTPPPMLAGPSTSSMTAPGPSHMRVPTMRHDISKMQQQIRTTGTTVITLKKDLAECKKTMIEQKKKLMEQEKKYLDHSRVVREQNTKIVEQDKKLEEVNRKLLEYDQKFNDLLTELARVRGDNQTVVLSKTDNMARRTVSTSSAAVLSRVVEDDNGNKLLDNDNVSDGPKSPYVLTRSRRAKLKRRAESRSQSADKDIHSTEPKKKKVPTATLR